MARWICWGLIVAGALVLSFSALHSIDDGQGPISEVIRKRRVAAVAVLFAAITMAAAIVTLYRLDHRTFRSYGS